MTRNNAITLVLLVKEVRLTNVYLAREEFAKRLKSVLLESS